jgi:hypothetical protein
MLHIKIEKYGNAKNPKRGHPKLPYDIDIYPT